MEEPYVKNKGNTGLDGAQFQLNLLIVFLLNALRTMEKKNWKISSEHKPADKFDDIVLQLPDKSVLLQSKFKLTQTITKDQLFSCNSSGGEFSLPKYFFSYLKIKPQFVNATVVICTNADVNENGLERFLTTHRAFPDHILHCEGTSCPFYTFNEAIVADLKSSAEEYLKNNPRGIDFTKTVITSANIKDFLEHLQFFYSYPNVEKLHNIIDQLLFRLNGSSLYQRASFQDISEKIVEWFKKPKGEYLTADRADAMFSEIKSDQFCAELKNYNLSFRRNGVDFTDSKQVFLIPSDGRYLLHALKIYDVLKKNEKKKLYVSPYDTVEVKKQIIEAFAHYQFHFLVIIGFNITDEAAAKEIRDKLKAILKKRDYKKVILVAGRNDKLREQFKPQKTLHVDGSVTFEDLSEECQNKLVTERNIRFQGNETSLQELLAPNTREVWTKVINSEILEELIKNNKIEIGLPPTCPDESYFRYYIHRTFKRQTLKNKTDLKEKQYLNTVSSLDVNDETEGETFREEAIYDVNELVVLIADSAGMGKTTTLAKLAVTIKNKNPHLWVIRIELSNYTVILRDRLTNRVQSIDLINLLNSRESTELRNSLEEFVFKMNKKVVLLLDGIDEISPEYTTLILNCLTQCLQARNLAKLFVTTRPHIVRQLEEILKVKSFILQPLTKQNQVDFLANYWSYNLQIPCEDKERCEKYANSLINKMASWTWSCNDFTAIPLQLNMLAEIFQEYIKSSNWECCSEFLKEARLEPKLPENMEITKVYEMFIEKKRNVYVNKGCPMGNTEVQKAMTDRFDKLLTCHKRLALEIILRKEDCQHFTFRNNYEDMHESLPKTGIIQITNNELNFIHRTFAEYFVAESLFSELKLQSYRPKVEFQQFLVDKIFHLSEYKVVRVFFDSFLQNIKSLIPNNIFDDYKSLNCYRLHWGNEFDLIHSLASDGCVVLLEIILKSMDFRIIRNKTVNTTEVRNRFFGKQKTKSKKGNVFKIIQYFVEEGGINIKDRDNQTPLQKAAENGHYEMVRFLVKQGATLNEVDNEGDTALHFAALIGHLNIVMYLVGKGADVNIVDKASCTALHFATAKSHLDVAEYLTESGSNINIKDNVGKTALHIAATNGSLNTVKFLLERGVDVNMEDMNGLTALDLAAAKGQLSVIEYLMESIGDINTKDASGRTALHFAAGYGVLNTVTFLLRRGADANIQDTTGMTALHLATENDHFDIVKRLIQCVVNPNVEDCRGRTPLHFAAANDNPNTVDFLLHMGADVHKKDKRGSTPLHLAVISDELRATIFLLARGANANEADSKGRTALHIAAENGNLDTVHHLLQKDADVNAKDARRATPLHLAVTKNKFYTVIILIQGGAEVNVKDNKARTPLHLSAANGYLKTTNYLLDAGAKVDIRDVKGRTALYLAVSNDQLDTTMVLLTRGSDVNLGDITGKTVLHSAAAFGILDVAVHFAKTRDYIDKKDINGSTALHFAVANEHYHFVKFLLQRKANINVKNDADVTPLHLAAGSSFFYTVKLLLENGADPYAKDIKSRTALHLAVENDYLDPVRVIRELLVYNIDVNDTDVANRTALHLAAKKGHLNSVKLLLSRGANVNAKEIDGNTPLHFAAVYNHLDIVNYLLELRADINIENSDGNTARQLALDRNYLKIATIIDDHRTRQSCVSVADDESSTDTSLFEEDAEVDAGNNRVKTPPNMSTDVKDKVALRFVERNDYLDTTKDVLKRRFDASIGDRTGRTALHSAAAFGTLKIAKNLAITRDFIDIKDMNGSTALHFAVANKHYHFVKFLLRRQANVNVKNDAGITPLHLAAGGSFSCTVKLLLDNRADACARDVRGRTALHCVAENEYFDSVKLVYELLIRIVDVNDKDVGSRTALHLAAAKGYLNSVKFLLSRGADVNAEEIEGNTPLHFAAARGHLDTVKYLLELGADINIENCTGNTARQLAIRKGHLQIDNYFEEIERDVAED